MEGLGRIYDLQTVLPTDMDGDPICEVSLRNAEGVTFFVISAATSTTCDLLISQSKNGANDKPLELPADLNWYHKLHGSVVPGTWTKGTPPGDVDMAAGKIDDAFTSGLGGIVMVYIDATWLDIDGGFDTVACQSVASGARTGAVAAIVHPKVQRTPANMPSLLPA